jgi:hypothetical protein
VESSNNRNIPDTWVLFLTTGEVHFFMIICGQPYCTLDCILDFIETVILYVGMFLMNVSICLMCLQHVAWLQRDP